MSSPIGGGYRPPSPSRPYTEREIKQGIEQGLKESLRQTHVSLVEAQARDMSLIDNGWCPPEGYVPPLGDFHTPSE